MEEIITPSGVRCIRALALDGGSGQGVALSCDWTPLTEPKKEAKPKEEEITSQSIPIQKK